MKLTPSAVYDRLVNVDKVLEANGKITFEFSDVSIIVKQKDVVGNILQEWLEGYLKKNGIDYAPAENPQMPPDFYLDPENRKSNLLEVKAFNAAKSPNFDIADFRMYEEEIIKKPWMLGVDYLIFGYTMSDTGVVKVKKIWIKKVWEICSTSGKWPMKLQVKKNVVHKIRPCTWYSKKVDYVPFKKLEDFISAVEETVYKNPATHIAGGTWLDSFLKSYKDYYGIDLNIPRWNDIKGKYNPS